MLKGIGASRGVSVKKVLVLKPLEIDTNKLSANASEEIAKYSSAIQKSISEIAEIKKNAKNLSPEELMVFDAQQQLANDPAMIEEINNIINSESCNAVHAIDRVSKQYIQIFSSMDDAYMRERAADIKDVYERIMANVLGLKRTDLSAINEELIIVAEDLTPSETGQLNPEFVRGFATDIGGRTSHSAIMARSLEIPAVLGLKNITSSVVDGDILAINGGTGEVIINPDEEMIKKFESEAAELEKLKSLWSTFKDKKSLTKDNKELIIAANIGSPKDLPGVVKSTADSVGLFRSEFLYMDNTNWPTEEEQFLSYKEVLQGVNGKQVVIRTLDVGGDKTLKYFEFPFETNPFLGYRAIRLCLDKEDIFRTQLRALIRASEFGRLAIMFPMIAVVDEFKKARKIFDEEFNDLIKIYQNISKEIEVGMMVEIPSSAVHTENFCKYADFVSIGTNDLMQYTMASDRMNEKVSYLYQPLNPSILKLIKMTIDGAHKAGKWVGMCGEMAGDINVIPLLVGMGLDEFSMSASSILRARELISRVDSNKAKELADKALLADDQEDVIKIMKEFSF
ncbi:MAG: phosphoenolpyruvate--protein phosphotransferase [Mycoplasma sp.]